MRKKLIGPDPKSSVAKAQSCFGEHCFGDNEQLFANAGVNAKRDIDKANKATDVSEILMR